jgi:hypothetical protein
LSPNELKEIGGERREGCGRDHGVECKKLSQRHGGAGGGRKRAKRKGIGRKRKKLFIA